MTKQEKEFLKKIGSNIALNRSKKGWTQVQFSEILRMNRSALARIEAGGVNSSIIILNKIAKALDVKITALLDFE